MKNLLLFFALFWITLAVKGQSVPQYEVRGTDTIYSFLACKIGEEPQFPGGDTARIGFLRRNMKYPRLAQELGIAGKVFISFVINADGTVSDVMVVKGVNPTAPKGEDQGLYDEAGRQMNAEALRVVSMFPQHKPGLVDGRHVKVKFNLPIKYSLN
jgi:hypothetical protein